MDLGRDRTAPLSPLHRLLCPYYHTHHAAPAASPHSLLLASPLAHDETFPRPPLGAFGDPQTLDAVPGGRRAEPQHCPTPAPLARGRRWSPWGLGGDTGAPSPGSEGGPPPRGSRGAAQPRPGRCEEGAALGTGRYLPQDGGGGPRAEAGRREEGRGHGGR